jgi:hypothetical protein
VARPAPTLRELVIDPCADGAAQAFVHLGPFGEQARVHFFM